MLICGNVVRVNLMESNIPALLERALLLFFCIPFYPHHSFSNSNNLRRCKPATVGCGGSEVNSLRDTIIVNEYF
jgi:hypothetical protein